ncbi:hypothetical protein OHB44_27890 [Micromonospora sp. NBC_00821]|uniref:hypothetical protein n=1 Tax=Micromonospora sp. NBC_00821 TaxID=2975977 RepID=UPI002ED0A75F|nr:hypothetical protein OHB44_27890 [Micromonospora sp. NBC_00821]
MSIDLDPGAVIAWTTPATEKPRQGGRHRWVKGGPVDAVGRRIITNPVGDGWRISPAAQQLATRTEQFIPVGPDEATGLLNPAEIPLNNEWTQPVTADRGQVLAEMRAELGDPAEVVAGIFTAAGCPVDTHTSTGTPELPGSAR